MLGGAGHAVERSRLMRVLAVAQILLLAQDQQHLLVGLGLPLLGVDGQLVKSVVRGVIGLGVNQHHAGERNVGKPALLRQVALGHQLLGHPVGNGGVVARRGGVDFVLQAAARGQRGGAVVLAHLGQHGLVVVRVNDHGHRVRVLGGGTQHAGTADVNVLDGVREGNVGVGDGLLELVEVHHDQVDKLDAVLGNLGHMLLGVAAGEKRAVHLGVQRLDAAVHHLREPGEVLDGADLHAGLLERFGRAAGRDDLNPELVGERACEIGHARLVRHRDQRAANLRICAHRTPSSSGPGHRAPASFGHRANPPAQAGAERRLLYCTAGTPARALVRRKSEQTDAHATFTPRAGARDTK